MTQLYSVMSINHICIIHSPADDYFVRNQSGGFGRERA